jgi:hypothetical protein
MLAHFTSLDNIQKIPKFLLWMDGLIQFEMQGVQKLKCATYGTMFMSEIDTDTCPSCSEQSHSHREYGSGSSMGGCGCGY